MKREGVQRVHIEGAAAPGAAKHVEPTHKKMDYFIHSAAASSMCDL